MSLPDNIWEIIPKDFQMQMIRNHVYVTDKNRTPIHYMDDMIDWCNENCSGLYRRYSVTFYFEEESDMVAFKLYWYGKKD